jgi:hypothetical protein
MNNDPSKKEDFVITPRGPRPKDRVHPVGPGEAIHIDERGNPAVIPRKELSPKPEEKNTNLASAPRAG